MKIEIDLTGPDVDNAIEEFLIRAEGSLVYYTPAYRRFLEEILVCASPLTFLAFEGGRIIGMLPAFVRKDPQLGNVLNSMPFFGGHGGAIVEANFKEQTYVAELLYNELASLIKNNEFVSVTVVENLFYPMTAEQERILNCAVVDDRIGQITKLPAGSMDPTSEIFSMIHQKTRNSVRKGQQLKMRFEERTDLTSLCWLQSVHEESIYSLGGVPKPLYVFEALTRQFKLGHRARLFVAYDADIPAAGILFLTHGDMVEYFTPVVAPNYRDKQALPALIFECMRRFSSEGFVLWNWGGTWRSQEGVYRFKQRWGAEQHPYRYFNRVIDQSIVAKSPELMRDKFPWFYLYRF